MTKIAALYTCHNRKTKTLKSLDSLFKSHKAATNKFSIDVYLTDDGSTDGTAEQIELLFPEVTVLMGDGNLFWAEGMRNSWKAALQQNYDAFLLLNDDVELYPNVFDQLFAAHKYCQENFKTSGIYIGGTEDKHEQRLTYSGSRLLNRFLYTRKRLSPNGKFQECDLGNANIMMVMATVVDAIGILTKGYSHGLADYDYTLMARKKNIPVLITPEYCGHCEYDHRDPYEDFTKKSLKERKDWLYKPTGLELESHKKYMRKFFPIRYPFVVFFGWLKLYFPKLYLRFFTNR